MAHRYSKPTKAEVWRRIDQNCRECIYDSEEPGNWVQQVEACQIERCPLWPLRRLSEKQQIPEGQAA